MAIGYFLRVGDSTTCGGKILTGDPTFHWYGVSAARQGDMASCGKFPGTYKISGGVVDAFDEGMLLAGSLDSFSSCPCHAWLIPSIPDSYAKESGNLEADESSTIKEAVQHISNLWIIFALPKSEDYSGLNYRLTMDDGSVHEGIFDENNKILLPSISASSCVLVEIEKPNTSDIISESISSQLLNNIMG